MTDKTKFKNAFSAVRAPEATLSEVIKMAENRNKNNRASNITKLPRIALIAAAMALIFCIGAGAYIGITQYEKPEEMFDAFFDREEDASGDGIVEYETIVYEGEAYEKLARRIPAWERMKADEEMLAKIAPYMYAIGESTTWDGYTLTVEAGLYDANIEGGLIYFTVENPDGIAGYTAFETGEVYWGIDSPYNVSILHPSRIYIDSSQSTETKLYLCAHFAFVEDWADEEWGKLRLSIGNGAMLERDDCSSVYIPLSDDGVPGLSFVNGKVKLSPIGVEFDEEGLGLEQANDINYLSVRFADGTEYIVHDETGFFSNTAYALDRGLNGDVTYLFNSLVDTDKVTEVVINDMVFVTE